MGNNHFGKTFSLAAETTGAQRCACGPLENGMCHGIIKRCHRVNFLIFGNPCIVQGRLSRLIGGTQFLVERAGLAAEEYA